MPKRPVINNVAVLGAGTMGALALMTGLRVGARDVLAVDVNDQRLETMRVLGASTACVRFASTAAIGCSPSRPTPSSRRPASRADPAIV